MTGTSDVYVDEPYLFRVIRDDGAVAYVSDTRRLRVIVHDDQEWIKGT